MAANTNTNPPAPSRRSWKGADMTSRAARKRRKRAISLPGGQQVQPRPTQGHRKDMDRSATETAITARLRICGQPDSPEARRAASAPENGCAVGRAIVAHAQDDRSDLWQAVCHMRRVWVAYDRAIGAPSRHAECLRILAPTEALTADAASPAPDMRPQDERDRAAISAWMALQGWLDHTDRAARSAAIRAVVDEPDEALHNWPGIKRALQCVVDGIKGRRVLWRGA